MILLSTGPFTATLLVTTFLTSGHQSHSPKHGNRRSCLHFTAFWFWIVCCTWSSWIFLNTEQNRTRQSPEALSSYLGEVRHGNDLGITDMKEWGWVPIWEITVFKI